MANAAGSVTPQYENNSRKNEWGTQFDRWLIHAAQKGLRVKFLLSPEYAKLKKQTHLVGVPLRIDKDMVQIRFENEEPWIQKNFFVEAQLNDTPEETVPVS